MIELPYASLIVSFRSLDCWISTMTVMLTIVVLSIYRFYFIYYQYVNI
jgi:hypothetical protein